MEWWLNSFLSIFPLPILIGMLIWVVAMCLFSLILLFGFVLLQKRATPAAELISIKECSNMDTVRKSGFSCDSLSLMSCETTRNDVEDTISSFYLINSNRSRQHEKVNSLPSGRLCPIINELRQMNTLPQSSTRRSIIRDLTSASNSFNDSKIHHSVDSLFSKDSLN